MYNNPYYNYWGVCPYMPIGGYPMGNPMEYWYESDCNVPKGMKELLLMIMQAEFYVEDLSLYLDTHPTDRKAIEVFNTYVEKLQELKEMYREKYGPLTHYEKSGYPYQYVQGPWPWQI
jgi:spore coat protein JB